MKLTENQKSLVKWGSFYIGAVLVLLGVKVWLRGGYDGLLTMAIILGGGGWLAWPILLKEGSNLAAAAPDLLKALEGVLEAARHHDSNGEYQAEIMALEAIAKAKK